jgi:HSP20 family protein
MRVFALLFASSSLLINSRAPVGIFFGARQGASGISGGKQTVIPRRRYFMSLSRWQPFSPVWNQLQQLQSEMNRLFDRWGDGGPGSAAGFPAVNLWEEGDEVFIEAELPGLDRNDLEIYVTGGNQLTLKGERKPTVPEKSVRHRQERGFGRFVRQISLPFPVNADKVDAHFENGVLLIKLAKHESAKPRKIKVKAE